jgi:predicted component of type VI protein secretion system
MAYLVVTMSGKELYRRELNGPVTLGRSTDCDLWLNDQAVSRRHCRFERVGDAWEVHDLGSRNGVMLHGERITKYTLRDGDALHIGAARVAFHANGYVSARPATPQGVGDSISDTIMANAAPRTGRVLPTPRATLPGQPETDATKPAVPLAFSRPLARPIPTASDGDNGNGKHREGLFRRFLHK